MINRQPFKWSGRKFEEIVENGERSILLRLEDPPQEFIARSDALLREEAAARLWEKVQSMGAIVEAARRMEDD